MIDHHQHVKLWANVHAWGHMVALCCHVEARTYTLYMIVAVLFIISVLTSYGRDIGLALFYVGLAGWAMTMAYTMWAMRRQRDAMDELQQFLEGMDAD